MKATKSRPVVLAIIPVVSCLVAIVSCIAAWKSATAADRSATAAEGSAETSAAMLWDARNADRAKREKAEYRSYLLGIDLGIYVNASQYDGERLAPAVAFARDSLRIRFAGVKDDLGLGDEVPGSFSEADIERIKRCIYDTYGQRAVDSFALGVDLGLAEGLLLPWNVAAKAVSSSPTVPVATFDQAAKLAEIVNRQLGILGFPQTIQLHDKSGASLFDCFNQLDLALVGAWDSQAGRWRRSPQSISAEEARE